MDIENRLVVGKGEGVGRGRERKFRVNRCKFLYIERMNKKDPDL